MRNVVVSARLGSVVGLVAGCLAVAGSAGPASGQAFSDDFNRASGTDLGAAWAEQSGDFFIVGDTIVRSISPGSPSVATVNGFSSAAPTVTLDLGYPSNFADFAYGGVMARYADLGNNVFVKVQNTGRLLQPGFDGLFFYYGLGGGWDGMTGGAALQEIPAFRNGRLTVTVDGSNVTVGIDTNFDDTPELTYTRGGLPLANLGTGVGMAVWSQDVAVDADNFTAVPEPTGASMLATAAAGLLTRRRRVR